MNELELIWRSGYERMYWRRVNQMISEAPNYKTEGILRIKYLAALTLKVELDNRIGASLAARDAADKRLRETEELYYMWQEFAQWQRGRKKG